MKKQDNPGTDSDKLRQKAEEFLKKKPIDTAENSSLAEARKLIYELQIFQAELEMQNQELELSKAQAKEIAGDKYAELFDFAPLGFFTLTAKGEIIDVNLSGAKLLGNERSQLKNSGFGTFVSDEAKPIFDLFLRNIFSKKNQQACELLITPDGNISKYVQLTGTITENGKQCLVTVVDITERKLAEQALLERNSRLEFVMQSADMAWWEMDLPSGNVTFANRKAEMLGYPPEKFRHYSDFTALVHPDDHEKVMIAMRNYIDGTLDKYDVEYQILTYTGEYKWFHDIGTVVKRDAKGTPLKITGLVLNITEHKHNEVALENERLLLRTLIDNIPDSIYSKDIACRKTLANLTEVRYMGANSEADVLGKDDFDIYPKEMAEKFYADDQLVIQTGKPVLNSEEYILDENGAKRWLLSSKLPLHDTDGRIIGLVGIGRDITDIKQAQLSLKESEALYRNLIKKLPDGVYKSTHDGKFVEVNPAMASMLGYDTKEDLMAIDIKTQLYFEPADRENVELNKKLEKVGIYRMKKKDGSEIWVEDHGWLNFDENLNTLFHEGIMRDVTDSKRAEWALQESEALYRNLVERLPDGLYKSTHEGKFVEVNPAMVKMLGYDSKDELLDIDIKTELYFQESDRESLVLQEKLEEMGIYRLKKKDGSAIWVEDHGWYIPDENGNVLFHEGIMRDITDRQEAEKALEYEHYLLNTLMNNVPSHIYFKDRQSRFIRINDAHARIFGLHDPTEAIGKTDFDFFSEEHAKTAYEDEQEIIRSGKPIVKEEKETWSDHTATWVSTTKMPLFDHSNNITGTFGISIDITERKLAEDALRNSETRARALIDAIPDLIFRLDKQGVFLDYKANFEDLAFQTESIIGKKNRDIMPPEFADLIDEEIRLTLQTGQMQGFEYQLQLPNKGICEFDARMVPCSSDEVIVIVRDVTERKQVEKALRDSEQRYRLLIETVNEGILVAQNVFLKFVNPMMQEITGFTHEELLTLPFINYVHTEDREIVISNHLKRLKGEQFLPRYQFRIVKKDGSIRRIEMNGIVIEWEGQPATLNMLTDITERKQAEETLQNERTLLRLLIDNVPDLMYTKDTACRKTLVNIADVQNMGVKLESEVLGKDDFAFFPKEMAEKFYADEQSVIQTGQPLINKEEYTLNELGQEKWFLTSKFPLRDQSGQIIGLAGIGRNITERKRAEAELKLKNEQLLKLNAEKDKFFSIIAHDLRGPFSGFLELTELMSEKLAGMTPDDIQRIARVMKNSATNLNHLIGNLLEWSLMQRGITTFNPTSFLLLSITQGSIALPLEAAVKKEIVVSIDIPEELKVYADGNMLAGILRNLVTNAVKFTPKGGSILMSAKQTTDNHVQISVKDTGIGMSNLMIQNLFHLDVNTSRKGTEGESSSGLGLIICKDFVEKHEGLLWVESQEGKGTTFHFTLPMDNTVQEIQPAESIFHAEETVNTDKKLKILIAENDETSEMLISIAVKPLSREIITVQNGAHAVEICRNNADIDLILMDIQMPEMDGYEATRLIRRFNKKVIIIAQTAYGLAGESEKAIEAGCDDFIMKPLDLALLKRLIHKHLYE